MRASQSRTIAVAVATVLAAGCAAQQPDETQAQNQAMRDFIDVRGLEEIDKIRVTDRDGWTVVTLSYLVYHTRKDAYLFEFYRPCYELRENTRITPDVRREPGMIRARFDTLRGCRIDRIYALTEAEAAEVKDIGETPGERN